MKFTIIARKIERNEALEKYIEKKLLKLEKFFRDEPEVKVVLSTQKGGQQVVEATIFVPGMIFRAEENANDMYASVDKVAAMIERQIRKNKTRLAKSLRDNAFAPQEEVLPEEEETNFPIEKVKRYAVKPMSPEEAILQMNLLGHEFFVFENAQSEEINLVYRRKDNTYGLIELE